jgi:hypothetical protein
MWLKTVFLLFLFLLSGCGTSSKQYLAELLAFSIVGSSVYLIGILISFFFPQRAEEENEQDEKEN